MKESCLTKQNILLVKAVPFSIVNASILPRENMMHPLALLLLKLFPSIQEIKELKIEIHKAFGENLHKENC